MSRQYLNERWCVRCGRTGPTPWLQTHWKRMLPKDRAVSEIKVVDIGCGNGRNSEFVKAQGVKHCVSMDMVPDYPTGMRVTLGHDRLPEKTGVADIVLANYVLMFLDQQEFHHVCREIDRIAAPGCLLMVELYAAKDSRAKTPADLSRMLDEVRDITGWQIVRRCIGKAIYQKEKAE